MIMPKVTQSVQNPNQGSFHNLTCTFELPDGVSSDLVQIEWSKDMSPLPSNSQIVVSNVTSTMPQQYTKTVTFRQVQPMDDGNYTCTVNIIGFTTSRDIITVNGENLYSTQLYHLCVYVYVQY